MARKATPRRQRADSITRALTAFQNAALGAIAPPKTVKLRPGDLDYWSAIVAVRARDEWSDIDLQHAANLARCLADIERISKEVAAEGDTLENARGTSVMNPKHSLIEVLSRRAVMLTRLLHLHAQAQVGRPAQMRDGRALEQAARATLAEVDEDDLLARPAAPFEPKH